MPQQNSLWPSEIRLAPDKKNLHITFEDGLTGVISSELLRVNSPSAEVQGHNPSEKKLIAGKANVMIIGVEPVGNYAIRLTFDDLHDSGIFGWGLLREFIVEGARLQADYEAEIARRGWSRER